MAQLGIRIFPDVLRSLDTSTLSGNFLPIGSATTHPGVILRVVNSSNVDITLSWDGHTAHDIIPAGSFLILDIATNLENQKYLNIATNTQFYVRGSAGTGFVYIAYYYTY